MAREPAEATTLTVQGVQVPKLGFGTWQVTGAACREGVADALALGYRHIDTARMYGNEREVGQGIADSGVPREEIWLTTKVWPTEAAPEDLTASFARQLDALDTGHVDLLLLHWPNPEVPLRETLGAMQELQAQGLTRHTGVSNFPSALLRQALDLAPVLADQVEYHAYLGQPALLELCRERDVMLTAYSPFAHGHLLDDPVLAEVAGELGRTPGQVALRWLLDQPLVSVIPKASSHERRAENLAVFDFALSDQQRGRIAGLERGQRTADPSFAPDWD